MKKRKQRGLERPKDTGLMRLMDAVWECSKNQLGILIGQQQQKTMPHHHKEQAESLTDQQK
jgi:hypothetical protein